MAKYIDIYTNEVVDDGEPEAVPYTGQNTTQYAWDLARAAAREYGGKPKDYFKEAMKQASHYIWEKTGADDIENLINYLDVELSTVSSKMYRYVERAHRVIISIIEKAKAKAEERPDIKSPIAWTRDRLYSVFGGQELIRSELKDLEFAIYHGSGYSSDEDGLPAFIRKVSELEAALGVTADDKWW